MRRNLYTGVLLLALIGCKQKDQNTIKETEISFKQEATGAIYRGDSLIAGNLKIEIADTPFERQTGLMYRESMNKDQGMWFVFEEEAPRYFYMKNTLISLDLLYTDMNHKIVSIVRNAQPLDKASLPSGKPAMYVLELLGGSADRLGIRENDSISISR